MPSAVQFSFLLQEVRTDTNLVGNGSINLRDETIDFRLTAHPKDISLPSARTSVIIRGAHEGACPRPEVTTLAAKGAASVALGALLTPAAAILPWLELGLGQDSPCAIRAPHRSLLRPALWAFFSGACPAEDERVPYEAEPWVQGRSHGLLGTDRAPTRNPPGATACGA